MSDGDPSSVASEGDCPLHHAEQAEDSTNISGDDAGVLRVIKAWVGTRVYTSTQR